MSSMKTNGEMNKSKRAMLNTTINEDTLNKFKVHCKELGCPMNTVIQCFMEGFIKGNFVLKIGKGNVEIDIDE